MRPRSAFTLVELIAAMGLGTFVLVTAVTAFRVASQAIAAANSVSTENALLRTGMQMTLDDADFWQSYASKDYPYLKGANRDRPFGSSSRWAYKRPFAAMTFQSATGTVPVVGGTDVGDPYHVGSDIYDPASAKVLNPNVLLPHDPRSFSRRSFFSREPPCQYLYDVSDYPNNGVPSPSVMFGNYALFGATDMRGDAVGTGELMQQQEVPLDATGTSTLPVTSNDPSVPPDIRDGNVRALNLVAAWNQNLKWRLWPRVGYPGSSPYLPPGLPAVPLDQRGYTPSIYTRWGGSNLLSSPWPVWMAGVGWNGHAVMRDDYPARDQANRLGRDFNSGTSAFAFAAIYENYDLSNMQIDVENSASDATFKCLMGGATNYNYNAFWYKGEGARSDYDHMAETIRIPDNPSDVMKRYQTMPGAYFDMVSKPSKMPMLTTSTLRYQQVISADLVLCRATVENREQGRTVDLTFTPLGTNYLGARQHWRLTSTKTMPTPGDDSIGDFYVP